MKTKLLTPADLTEYKHPAIILFRSLELKCTYENTKNLNFKQPSMDLGSGDGYLASILFDEKFTYGIDNGEANDYQTAIDKKRYGKVLVESAEKMSLKNDSLNFIFCNSVIEHIPGNEAVLSEVSRTLKKGGAFVFTSPSDKFKEFLYVSNLLQRFSLEFMASRYKNYRQTMLNHYHTLSHEEWTKRLKKHNLKIINYDYYISKETCMLWDQIALQVRIQKLFDPQAEKELYKEYKKQINEIYVNDRVEGSNGASLFIHAVKI
ncbi:class I SAM-dependent methyltransferase [soil metagenome]